MSQLTWQTTARRIIEHSDTYNVSDIALVIHGGEPLLLGKDNMTWLLEDLSREFAQKKLNVDWSIQTNGLLLDQEWIDIFIEYNVPIGISIDGDEITHNQNRKTHAGKGSYADALKAVKLLQSSERNAAIFGGILSVINIDSKPNEVIDHFLSIGIESLDFLLPDCNHNILPYGKDSFSDTSYGDWLVKLFDVYINHPEKNFSIRIFDILLGLIMGYRESIDAFSPNPIQLAVIQTNGEIEAHDAFKASVETSTGFNVFDHTFDDLHDHYLISLQHSGVQGLSNTCLSCKYGRVCNGGYLPHRYSHENGFNNPSIYCLDIYKLIDHMSNYIKTMKSLVSQSTF